MPRVSVVVPAFNNESFIAETLRSVLSQDFGDFELIVSDHSSTDSSREIIENFAGDRRVTVLSTAPGGGAWANWRRVTDAASGEYLKLLPGDDVLYPGALESHVDALAAHPSVALVSSPRDILTARGDVRIRNRGLQGVKRGVQSGVDVVRHAVRRGTNVFGEPGCVTMRRSSLESVGGWDGQFPYLIDQTTFSRVLFTADFLAVDRVLAGFRVSTTQWSVALMGNQARDAKAYNRWCRHRVPARISASDVWIGNRRAEAMALARRAFYSVNRQRMVVES